jgi:hypothetical protein
VEHLVRTATMDLKLGIGSNPKSLYYAFFFAEKQIWRKFSGQFDQARYKGSNALLFLSIGLL